MIALLYRLTNFDTDNSGTANGVVSTLKSCGCCPTGFRVQGLNKDGRVSRRGHDCRLAYMPWRAGAKHGAQIFVVGSGALCERLYAELDAIFGAGASGYRVYRLDRAVGADMEQLISDDGIWWLRA